MQGKTLKKYTEKKLSAYKKQLFLVDKVFCRPTYGGKNYILKWVLFVQTIFANRCTHRRELRLESLESSSAAEYGNKKILFNFVSYEELSRNKLLTK